MGTGGKWRILLIATQERYLQMEDGSFFSTGNHPVEMLLPMLHLDAAGFDIDIATISGQPVKLEMWAFPKEDAAVKGIYEKYLPKILRWAHANGRFLITLCHGPACMLAANLEKPAGEKFIYEGHKIDVFPDSLDKGPNIDIGYIPGKMQWVVGEELRKLGVEPLNEGITGATHQDRLVLTGDSPLASNNLGKLAAEKLLEEAKKRDG